MNFFKTIAGLALLVFPVLSGCSGLEGTYCSSAGRFSIGLEATLREKGEGLQVDLKDSLHGLSVSCELSTIVADERYVGPCTGTTYECLACGVVLDIVDDDTIFVNFTGYSEDIGTSARRCDP